MQRYAQPQHQKGWSVAAARVLVVEDVPELSRLLEMTLELDDRFEPVGTAMSGGAALDLATRERPDAIVLDIAIEGVDGIGVLPMLRRIVPAARIIVFTGHDDSALRNQAFDAGASAWVLKGGDLGTLLDELAAATGQRAEARTPQEQES